MRYETKSIKHTNRGFTFLEVIIAIFVMSIGIVGTLLAVHYAISSTSQSYSRLAAAYLAQEGIEIVRNIRDGNWLEGRTVEVSWDDGISAGDWQAGYTTQNLTQPYLGNYLNIDSDGFYSYSLGQPTQFKRKITIEKPETHILKISVIVYWGGGEHYLTAQENLYNWHSAQ